MIVCSGVGYSHIGRTGGESVRIALMTSGLPCYYIGKIWEPEEDIKSNSNRYRPHYPPSMVSSVISPDLKLVTCVRNPWDRYVSWFHWHLGKRKEQPEWPVFLEKILDETNPRRITTQKEFIEGIDWSLIMRFENLRSEWLKVQEMMGHKIELPHSNQGEGRSSYQGYYSPRQKKAVAKSESYVIDRFGYKF